MGLSVASNNEQKVKITASPKTSTGRPAALDGPLTIAVVSGEGTFAPVDGEPNSFYVISGDNPGSTQYAVKADADLGAGVVEIADVVDYEVSGAQAENFGLVAGAPEPK